MLASLLFPCIFRGKEILRRSVIPSSKKSGDNHLWSRRLSSPWNDSRPQIALTDSDSTRFYQRFHQLHHGFSSISAGLTQRRGGGFFFRGVESAWQTNAPRQPCVTLFRGRVASKKGKREREGERAKQERMVKEERQARPDDGGGGWEAEDRRSRAQVDKRHVIRHPSTQPFIDYSRTMVEWQARRTTTLDGSAPPYSFPFFLFFFFLFYPLKSRFSLFCLAM